MALGVELPDSLRGLLEETDGIRGEYELGVVWNLDRIVRENLSIRSDPMTAETCMPFDHLLFFADAGNGDLFAFAISRSGRVSQADIYAWKHEDDSRQWVAASLQDHLERWLSGDLAL